jgi:hypothetical protein
MYSPDDGPLEAETCCDAVTIATPTQTDSCYSGYIYRRVCHVYVTQQDAPIGIQLFSFLQSLPRSYMGVKTMVRQRVVSWKTEAEFASETWLNLYQ